MRILSPEDRGPESVPKARPARCHLQDAGIWKSDVVVALELNGAAISLVCREKMRQVPVCE